MGKVLWRKVAKMQIQKTRKCRRRKAMMKQNITIKWISNADKLTLRARTPTRQKLLN